MSWEEKGEQLCDSPFPRFSPHPNRNQAINVFLNANK